MSVAAENEEGVSDSAFGTGTTLPLCESVGVHALWNACMLCIYSYSHQNALIFGSLWGEGLHNLIGS